MTGRFLTEVIVKRIPAGKEVLREGLFDIFLNGWQQPSGQNYTDSMEVLLSPILQEETIFPWSHVVKYFGFYMAKCHIKVSLVDNYPDKKTYKVFK